MQYTVQQGGLCLSAPMLCYHNRECRSFKVAVFGLFQVLPNVIVSNTPHAVMLCYYHNGWSQDYPGVIQGCPLCEHQEKGFGQQCPAKLGSSMEVNLSDIVSVDSSRIILLALQLGGVTLQHTWSTGQLQVNDILSMQPCFPICRLHLLHLL